MNGFSFEETQEIIYSSQISGLLIIPTTFRAVDSMRQTEALAPVIFSVFYVIFFFIKHPKYLGREILTMDIA